MKYRDLPIFHRPTLKCMINKSLEIPKILLILDSISVTFVILYSLKSNLQSDFVHLQLNSPEMFAFCQTKVINNIDIAQCDCPEYIYNNTPSATCLASNVLSILPTR